MAPHADLGIFEMQHNGLAEVTNPSEVLINKNNEGLSGITTAATIDGIRPFLIEVQALVSTCCLWHAPAGINGI